MNLETRQSRPLTSGGAVNVEPRFSPDGKRIAFVSTSVSETLSHLRRSVRDGELTDVKRLTGETRSDLPRYYYSEFDHEISPAWSPDGTELIFVSNRGHIYGTGGFWRMKAEPGAEAREIHYEETTWKARPDFSPDGKRIVYASYLGQQWHQLWVMPSAGGDAFPLSYGDFDNVNPRWSPDGTRIAFISNRDGNTSLWTQEVPGGAQSQVVPRERHYLQPMGRLRYSTRSVRAADAGARVFVTGEDGRAYAPDDAWMHADDNFVRSERTFEAHYFHTSGDAELTVPVGRVDVEVMKGFEYRVEERNVQVTADQTTNLTVQLQPLESAPAGAFPLGQRRRSRAHELRRRLSQHAEASGRAGRGRKSFHRRRSDRQQRAAHSRHRLLQHQARSGIDRVYALCFMARNSTRAIGDISACST